MHQGLIPVVSRETDIDTNEFGITLESCSIEVLVAVVKDLSERTSEWCAEMSKRTRKAALADFSEITFLQNMRAAIKHVISKKAR
jgi:hypothetical protein